MADWSHGYVTDVEYQRELHREQGPAHLDVACLLNGVEPPDRQGEAAYCDLGCGPGYGVALLAATNPAMHFWGIDFNPAHIAGGRALQSEVRLPNLHLVEASFAELVGRERPALPLFDYIALHGVYTWIAESDRQAIVSFLARHLKPGGLVYVGYNCLPGWLGVLPMQRLIWEQVRRSRERTDRMMGAAIGFLRRVADAGARELQRSDALDRLERLLADGKQQYLAHEYANRHWTPIYHTDLVEDLVPAKLSFIGSASLIENFPELSLTPPQRQLVEEVREPAFAETLRDYFTPRSFRRDIFVRGARRLRESERTARLREVRVALTALPEDAVYELKLPIGETRLNERLYRPVFEALAAGPATIGELLDLPPVKALGTANSVELVGMLVGTAQALPVIQPAEGAAYAAALAFNRVVAGRAVAQGHVTAMLAAAAAGSGVSFAGLGLVAYARLVAGAPPEAEALAAAVGEDMAACGLVLREAGEPIHDPAKVAAVLRDQAARVIARLPVWRQLGAI
jgi:SAM-dependent methyltransferase